MILAQYFINVYSFALKYAINNKSIVSLRKYKNTQKKKKIRLKKEFFIRLYKKMEYD